MSGRYLLHRQLLVRGIVGTIQGFNLTERIQPCLSGISDATWRRNEQMVTESVTDGGRCVLKLSRKPSKSHPEGVG